MADNPNPPSGGGTTYIGCRSVGNGMGGFSVGSNSHLEDCDAIDNAGPGFSSSPVIDIAAPRSWYATPSGYLLAVAAGVTVLIVGYIFGLN